MRILLWIAASLAIVSAWRVIDDLEGKITAIDAKAGIVEISGVKMLAKNAEIVGPNESKLTIIDLKVGDYVDGDGNFSGKAEFTATRIEREADIIDQIEGKLTAVDSEKRTLTISGVTIKVPEGILIMKKRESDLPIKIYELTIGDRAHCEGKWTGPKELTARTIRVNWEAPDNAHL
ncbi:MAG: DUF5666 domain-containing protein [Candidatus Aureabacteria bacterium]|nr:DUF5666 domain-containing protein [Candidatus Auribacterota bacterium]